MQLSIKTVSGEEFRVEVEPTATVGKLKEIINAQRPEFPAPQQKLIYAGKVLKDDQVIQGCGIVEKKFLVLMISKPKAPKPAATAQPPSTTSAPNTNSGTTTSAQSPTTASNSTATPTPSASTTTQNTQPALARTAAPPQAPTVRQEDVDNLVAMGFVESECRAALQAALRVGGDQNVAVEFLMNGIPPNLPMGPPSATTTIPSANTQAQTTPGPISTLAELRNHPQFAQIRQLVQSNPSALETVLQHIGQQNPQLLQLIRSNQAEFLQMLNEPISNTQPQQPAPQQMPLSGGMPQGAGGMPSPAQLAQVFSQMSEEERDRFAQTSGIPRQAMNQMIQAYQNDPESLGAAPGGGPQPHVIHLTAEEATAVTQLTELGFSQQEAVEAFLACDRNHEAAANFLLSGLAEEATFMAAPDLPPQQTQSMTATTTTSTTTTTQNANSTTENQPSTTPSSNSETTDAGANETTGDSKDDDEDMYS